MSGHEAGRELDALIAEKVMGLPIAANWRAPRGGPVDPYFRDADAVERENFYQNGKQCRRVPRYSTAIAAAWTVHLLMCDKLFSVRRRYFAALQKQAQLSSGVAVAWPDVMVVLRDSFPKAICLAALAALATVDA